MSPRTKLKIAVWGYGRHAKNSVIPAILQSPVFELAGVCSRQRNVPSQQHTLDHDILFLGVDELLAGDADLIYVCTPIGLHHQNGLAVLNAGKHLLCEKSLTNRIEDSLQLFALAKQQKLFIGEAFMYVFHPRTSMLKQMIQDRELGNIKTITCEFGIPKLEQPGFRDSARLGGSAFWDVGCYNVSLVTTLLTHQPQVISAIAEPVLPSEGVDQGGSAVLRFPSNVSAFLAWGYQRAYRNSAVIWGDQGCVVVDRIFSKDGAPGSIERYDLFGRRTDIHLESTDAFVRMLNYVGENLDDPQFRKACWETANRQAAVMDAIRRKMESNTAAAANVSEADY